MDKNEEVVRKDAQVIAEAFKEAILKAAKEWPREKFEMAVMPEKFNRGNNEQRKNT